MNPARPQPQQTDEAWAVLRAQLEWRAGFGLFFLFAPHQGAATALRSRLEAWLQTRTLRLRTFVSETPQALQNSLVGQLMDEIAQLPAQTPVWIEAEARPFDEPWNRARSVFLARLNERRGALESGIRSPVIIVLPVNFRNETRRIAPDLWHVRVWSGELPGIGAQGITADIRVSGAADVSFRPAEGKLASLSQRADSNLAEWHSLVASVPRDRINLGLGYEAFDSAMKAQRLEAASTVSEELETLARGRTDFGRPASLRDLSLSLNKVGEVKELIGKYEEARAAYSESVALRRKINAAIGETPQGMHDLSVSLDKLGGVNQSLGEYEAARAVYLESLTLCRKINAATGETPVGMRELSVVLNHVGWVDQILGSHEFARAAYTESLDLSRKIVASVGETPQSLYDLSVSLERMGGLNELLGHFEAARAAYAESLELRRKINATAGETPQRLRDLGISISKVGGVDHALGLYAASRAAAKESLELFRKINADIGETPQGLFDLAAALLQTLSFLKADDDAKVAGDIRREARDLLARLRADVGAYWEGSNLNELIKTIDAI